MILTIIPQNHEGTNEITASALARRRANAGRNVLLLSQNTHRKKPNQHKKATDNVAWLSREMKIGARTHTLLTDALADELAQSTSQFHDVVIDLPMPTYTEARIALESSSLLVFTIQLATWDDEKYSKLLKRIKTARRSNSTLPVLTLMDEIESGRGQHLINSLAHAVPNIQFMQLARSPDLSLENLYRAIYNKSQ